MRVHTKAPTQYTGDEKMLTANEIMINSQLKKDNEERRVQDHLDLQ